MRAEPQQCELIVAMASDLARLEPELAKAFQVEANCRVRFSIGSSGALARQIQSAAPFDAFLSANRDYVTQITKTGHAIPGTARAYGVGRLALWSKPGLAWTDLVGSSKVRHLAIANPAHAPYGMAARQAIEKAGWWTNLKDKLVYSENVRQALQFAESGNADAALTAWSLVHDRGGILVDESLHAPIEQTAVVLKASRTPEMAKRFLDFLASPTGREILKRYGFQPK